EGQAVARFADGQERAHDDTENGCDDERVREAGSSLAIPDEQVTQRGHEDQGLKPALEDRHPRREVWICVARPWKSDEDLVDVLARKAQRRPRMSLRPAPRLREELFVVPRAGVHVDHSTSSPLQRCVVPELVPIVAFTVVERRAGDIAVMAE